MGDRIEPENKQHLEDTAAYLVRNPLSLRKLVYLDGERAVVYRFGALTARSPLAAADQTPYGLVEKHIDKTRFAWIGGTKDGAVFYYRIQSPVILIEFDHQGRIAPFRTQTPTREHIHTVVRTPNGNDYGKDLLRLHHAQHPHGGEAQGAGRRGRA